MTEPSADLVLLDGPVITMADGDPIAEAVAVRDGRIAAVGNSADIRPWIGSRTKVYGLEGRSVVPGLIDCHTHVATDAKDGAAVELRDFYVELHSVAELLQRLAAAARTAPVDTWIVGRAGPMQDRRMDERRLPSREELDQCMDGRPGYVTFGSHVLIANSEAMRRLGIDAGSVNPRRGLIVKDPASGEPTGEFRDGSGAFFSAARNQDHNLAQLLSLELDRCVRRGVTGIHDVVASADEIAAYQDLLEAEKLPIRVQLLVRVVHGDFASNSLRGLGVRQGFGGDLLRFGGVKCSVDGGFTGRTAAFSQPLSGEDHGTMRIQADELDDLVGQHHQAGIRVCVHAIGDRALDITLAAFAKAVTRLPRRDLRHRIEHMGNWLCSEERLVQAKALGLCAVPNPAMLYFLADEIADALGRERATTAFPFRRLRDAGVPFGFGSDGPGLWPSDPLRDVATALSRTARSGRLMAPSQAIPLTDALRAQTLTAAWLGYDEHRVGSIEVGKLADLVVLHGDPRTLRPSDLEQMAVDATIVSGRFVHGDG